MINFLKFTASKPMPRWRIARWWRRDDLAAMRESLLRVLATAHQQRLAPAPLVLNLAQEHRGSQQRTLLRLATRLGSGLSVVDAIEQTPEALGRSQALALRFASQTGTLDQAYPELVSGRLGGELPTAKTFRQVSSYLMVLSVVLIALMGFVLTFIFPTIIKIADEYGSDEGPQRFSTLLWLTRWVTPGKLLLAFAALLALPLFVRRTRLGMRLREAVVRRVGWVHRLRVGELLRMLAWSTDSGRPLSAALSSLARYHYDSDLRGKLLFARNEVEQGMPPWESLQASRILSPSETQAIVGATSNDSRSWLLRTMAMRKEDDAHVAAEAAVEQFHTLAILAIGVIVLIISVAGFGTLAQLVLSLA